MAPKKGFSERSNAPEIIGVVYARYSSHNQKEESIEQQVDECKKFAAENHIKVVDIYADKAVSGKTDRRTNFQKMMRDAEKQKFQIVIAYKSNRIGRNMLQALGNEDKLATFGVRVLYAKEEFGDTAAGRFALRTMMNVNQFYSENMAEDIRRGLIDNANKCMVNKGGLPLGYKKGEDGKYAIDGVGAAVVREIFESVQLGKPFTEIANDLNGRGIKTSRGNLWNKNSFHAMLKNEIYIGVYKYAEVRIEGGVPAIIGKELFYKVQDKLTSKKNPQGRHRENGDYLLTGKLFCGKCKSFMVGISGTSKTGTLHYYYICQKKRLEKACDKKTVRRDYIERIVAEDIQTYIMRDEVMEWIADEYVKFQSRLREESELKIEERQLNDVKKAIKNVMTAIEQGIITATTRERLVELESEQKRLEASVFVGNKELPTFTKEQVLFWLESFKDGDVNDKKYQKRLIDAFVDSIYLYDDEIRIVFGYAGEDNTIKHKLPSDVDVDAVGDGAECSYKFPPPPPQESQTNPAAIYMVGQVFVLVAPITNE